MEPPTKSRDELLATPIGSLCGWIGVRCATCSRKAFLPLKRLCAQRGRNMALGQVVARLKCEYCKSAPAHVWLTDYPIDGGDHGGQVASWRVVLAP